MSTARKLVGLHMSCARWPQPPLTLCKPTLCHGERLLKAAKGLIVREICCIIPTSALLASRLTEQHNCSNSNNDKISKHSSQCAAARTARTGDRQHQTLKPHSEQPQSRRHDITTGFLISWKTPSICARDYSLSGIALHCMMMLIKRQSCTVPIS